MAEINIKEFGKTAYKCNKCNHVWFSRGDERPLTCPKCKSARWDKEPKKIKHKDLKVKKT
jgi:rubrerythrin